MQLSARKALEGTPQVNGKLHNIVPRAEKENIVTAGVDDMHIALRLLLPTKEGELLRTAPHIAATNFIDISLEEQGQLTRQ